MKKKTELIKSKQIIDTISFVRGQRVIMDMDLAKIYGVPIKRLNEQVKRNRQRFPDDFAFQLTPQEAKILRSQMVTLEQTKNLRS